MLVIKYDTGQMKINMDRFFPLAQNRFKKFLKIMIELDAEHEEEHIQTLIKHFNDRIEELERKRITSGKAALEHRQKVVDYFAMIESGKHPNGVRLTKDEMKEIKQQHKEQVKLQANCVAENKRCIRRKEQFKGHLKILEQRK